MSCCGGHSSGGLRKDHWVEDYEVSRCSNPDCNVTGGRKFGTMTRKHHCRMCGGVFCFECSDNLRLLDDMARPCESGPHLEKVCESCMYTIDDIVLSRKEVIKLKRMFRILTGCWDDVPTPIFMERFNKVLPFPVPVPLLKILANMYDPDGDGTVQFSEFVHTLKRFEQVDFEAKIAHMFHALDKDASGHVDLEELGGFLKLVIKAFYASGGAYSENIHVGYVCIGCGDGRAGMPPFRGTRYSCRDCEFPYPGYNLCRLCLYAGNTPPVPNFWVREENLTVLSQAMHEPSHRFDEHSMPESLNVTVEREIKYLMEENDADGSGELSLDEWKCFARSDPKTIAIINQIEVLGSKLQNDWFDTDMENAKDMKQAFFRFEYENQSTLSFM